MADRARHGEATPGGAATAVAFPGMAADVVRSLTRAEHVTFLAGASDASFLQVPAWATVKPGWRAESVGWVRDGVVDGAGLVLHRAVPRIRRSLAYLPEGPVLDWTADDLADRLDALAAHQREARAFAVRVGPPVPVAVWEAPTVKAALADPAVAHLRQVTPDERPQGGARVREVLRSRGWRPPPDVGGFGTGQPQFVFQLPLGGRDEAQVLAGMNQMWRRNIARSRKEGVVVAGGGRAELADFHHLYVETARRDGFAPRGPEYFHRMYDALADDDVARLSLHLARHGGDLVAATLGVQVGEHAWYSYGASSTAKREVRGSHAVQWHMITGAIRSGATVYDLRGVTPSLDESDRHAGLTRFKVGTGGRVVELVGEWTLPLIRPLAAAFDLYMRRRGGG